MRKKIFEFYLFFFWENGKISVKIFCEKIADVNKFLRVFSELRHKILNKMPASLF